MTEQAEPTLNQQLGNAIRLKRIEHGMSQQVLGERAGVTFQQIQKYEKGVNQVSFPKLVALAAALNVTPADLIKTATGGTPSSVADGLSDRATLELVKRISTLAPNQREGVRLLVNQLAGGGHE